MSGPTITFSIVVTSAGASLMNSVLKKSSPSRPMKPASKKPAPVSFESICQSPRKLWATSDHASLEVSRGRKAGATERCGAAEQDPRHQPELPGQVGRRELKGE